VRPLNSVFFLRLLQLLHETLFLTTNLIDRFLEASQVARKNLQLVRMLSHPAFLSPWLDLDLSQVPCTCDASNHTLRGPLVVSDSPSARLTISLVTCT
jgi:Cyclin, N-terminal domain